MFDDIPEKYDLVDRALSHYSIKLGKIIYDTESITYENNFVKQDILNEITLMETLKTKLRGSDYKDGEYLLLDEPSNNRLALDALRCYRTDLEKSVESVKEKLAVENSIHFELTRKEIQLCDHYLKHGFYSTQK